MTPPISSHISAGFEPVEREFHALFDEGLEHGARFCLYQNGEPLIDLIGGWADKDNKEPLNAAHLISVYSTGKVAAAIVIAWLVDQGRLDYDQPVIDIWPEFNTHGKDRLSVAEIMSHQSGLSGITDPSWQPVDWYDWDKTCHQLAAQAPIFPPTTASGYSPLTYGFLCGELARRVDIGGRHLGQILREEICAPLAIDVWLGLAEDQHHRCADMQRPKKLPDFGELNDATRAAFLRRWSAPGGKPVKEWRKAQMTGSNCQASAQGLARLAHILVNGTLDGRRIISETTHHALTRSRIEGMNLVLPFEINFAAGVMRNDPHFFFGPGRETLGHSGWGGSCLFADPERGLTGAYTMTKQDNSLLGDMRPRRLIDLAYRCL